MISIVKKLLFVASLFFVFGCETDDQVADRVLKKRELLKTVEGSVIVSITDTPYRTTTIVLSDGRKIVVNSGRSFHETKVIDK